MLGVASVLALSAAAVPAFAAPGSSNTNSIKCTAISFGSASSYSKNAFVDFGLGVAALACGGKGGGKLTIKATAEDVAVAVAKATAATYVSCESKGSGVYGHAQAYAKAASQAEAFADAIGEGWASIETCNGCRAAADLLVTASKDIFVKAIAESQSELKVYGDASGREKFKHAGEVVEVIKKKVAKAYVDLIIEVQVAVEKGEESCGVTVAGCAGAGNEYGCCILTAGSAKKAIETDAIAEVAVGAFAEAYTCGDEYQEADAHAYAEAIAEAWVKAVSAVNGYCKSTHGSSACAWGESDITAVAKAQAKAFAEAYATADNKCNCKLDVDATASAIEKIFVKVHTSAIGDACVVGKGFDKVHKYDADFKQKSVTAIADALAFATADHEECDTFVTACASSGSSEACCEVSATGYGESRGTNAYAEAEAAAGAFSCGDKNEVIEAQSDVFVKAIAEAWAAAIVDLNQYCFSNGKADACSVVDGHVAAWAEAEAKALATAWAGTAAGCDCELEVEAVSKKMGKVAVDVLNNVHKKLCVKGDDFDANYGLIIKEVTKSKAAIARAIAELKTNGTNCKVGVAVGTDVTKDTDAEEEDVPIKKEKKKVKCGKCVKRGKCGGRTPESVVGCCNKKHVCVQKNHRRYVCKNPHTKKGRRAIRRFKRRGYGQVAECHTGH